MFWKSKGVETGGWLDVKFDMRAKSKLQSEHCHMLVSRRAVGIDEKMLVLVNETAVRAKRCFAALMALIAT